MSQDRHEIYITVAEYGQNYVKYLENELAEGEKPGFLTIRQFGPWSTKRRDEMEMIAPYLLAISIRAEGVR